MAFNSNNAIFFSIFIQAFHYMQKKSGFGGPFFERFVHLYFTFVTMHKTYFEFLCKNSFALSTTLFHTFLRIESKIFQFCSFAQMNCPDFVVIAKGFVEGVISGLFSPLLHSR